MEAEEKTRLEVLIQPEMLRKETKTADELKKFDERFFKIFDNNPVGMVISNLETSKYQYVNEKFAEYFGYTKEEVIGKTAFELNLSDPEHREKIISGLKSKGAVKDIEILVRKKNGETFWALVSVQMLLMNDEKFVLSSFYNISERKKASAALMIANQELVFQNAEKEKRAAELIIANKELVFQNAEKEKRAAELTTASEKLIKAESQVRNFAKYLNHVLEHERARIAREIHDELGQQLAGIKMGLSSFKKFGNAENAIEEKVKGIMKDVDVTIQSLRKIATELRPGILDTLGLIPSIQWLVKEFENKTKMKCRLEINTSEHKFEKNISTCYFRICQEALTNVSKHANASEVIISIRHDKDSLMLKISDNGKGIVSEKLENPFSMGLLGMRERANIIGGDFYITSKKDSGTIVQLQANVN